jgi:hypothetical protein
LNAAPQRLQKSELPAGSGVPQDGQAALRGAGLCANVVPQRVQKRDWLSTAGLPQAWQTTGSGGIRVPHRLQNCASSSDTTAPHPGQTGKAVFFSSGTVAPHRLQKSAWSSSPAWPHLPQVLDMYFTIDKTGSSINTVIVGPGLPAYDAGGRAQAADRARLSPHGRILSRGFFRFTLRIKGS